VVVCLEQGASLHMAQLMPLPLTVSCFSKIQIGFTFLVPAHLGSPGKRAVKRVCVSLLSFCVVCCNFANVAICPSYASPLWAAKGIKFLTCPFVCACMHNVHAQAEALSDWLVVKF